MPETPEKPDAIHDPMYSPEGQPVNGVIHLVDQVQIVNGKIGYRMRALTIRDGLIVKVDGPNWQNG